MGLGLKLEARRREHRRQRARGARPVVIGRVHGHAEVAPARTRQSCALLPVTHLVRVGVGVRVRVRLRLRLRLGLG